MQKLSYKIRMKFRKRSLTILGFACTSLLLSGCLSLSTIQTGKTIGEDNVELALSGSYGRFSQISVLDNEGDFDNQPLISVSGQYGVSDRVDIGLRFNQNTFVGPTVKWQIMGNKESTFAGSIGLDIGFNFFAFVFGNFTYYTTIPLYLSYHPKNSISFYLTPRYLITSEYIFVDQSINPGKGDTYSLFGGSYGIILGDKHKIALEASNFGKKLYRPSMLTLGYIYTLGKRK
jgi:hypothetical protein